MKKTLSRVVNLSAVAVILLGAFQAVAINMLIPDMAGAGAVVVVTSKSIKTPTSALITPTPQAAINLDDFNEYATGTAKTLDLKVGQIVHFTTTRNGVIEHHTATVKEVGGDYVIITIASIQFDVRLQVAEVKTVTIDGTAALRVGLQSIYSGLANLQFSKQSTPAAFAMTKAESGMTTRDIANFFGLLCLFMAGYLAYEAARPEKSRKRTQHRRTKSKTSKPVNQLQ